MGFSKDNYEAETTNLATKIQKHISTSEKQIKSNWKMAMVTGNEGLEARDVSGIEGKTKTK